MGDELADAVAMAPEAVRAAVAALLARACPTCGARGTILTSRKHEKGRTAHLACRQCGRRWKAEILGLESRDFQRALTQGQFQHEHIIP